MRSGTYLILGILLLISCQTVKQSDCELSGTAEDLWGDKIDLTEVCDETVIFHPFSTANCGYCLIDGEFIKVNYGDRAKKHGQRYYDWALYNPQRDICAFQKCHEDDFPVITAPYSLEQLHKNGYPWLIVFKQGKLIYSEGAHPYQEVFDSLQSILWPNLDERLYPTSPLKLADNFQEDTLFVQTYVLADGATALYEHMADRTGDLSYVHIRYESELTDNDLGSQLVYLGLFSQFSFKHLNGRETPIRFAGDSISVGGISFDRSAIGLMAGFPNPYNAKTYVSFDCRSGSAAPHLWADYWIHQRGEDGRAVTLLEGLFAKQAGSWTFSPALAFGPALPAELCAGSLCPGPPRVAVTKTAMEAMTKAARGPEEKDGVQSWIMGEAPSRFPSILTDADGNCWATWEQAGNVMLAKIGPGEKPEFIPIEMDSADSYDPQLAEDGRNIWVFFLCNSSGFYRLYGVYYDGATVSRPVLIDQPGPFHSLTPAATQDHNGTITVYWSEKKANQRFLKSRRITNGILGNIEDVELTESGLEGGYSNGWYPALHAADDNTVWAAWNQHYPHTIGVHAAETGGEALTVYSGGGYPSICTDSDGVPWVIWRSGWFEEDYNYKQLIYSSRFDGGTRQWSLPEAVSQPELTLLNDTPQLARDTEGILHVCWSGRTNDDSPWNVYLSSRRDSQWTAQDMISTGVDHARAPAMCAGPDGVLWVAWHEGAGSQMRIKVQYLLNPAHLTAAP